MKRAHEGKLREMWRKKGTEVCGGGGKCAERRAKKDWESKKWIIEPADNRY